MKYSLIFNHPLPFIDHRAFEFYKHVGALSCVQELLNSISSVDLSLCHSEEACDSKVYNECKEHWR